MATTNSAIHAHSTAPREPDNELETETDPKRVANWLENLPILNPAVSVRAMLGALKQLNTLKLSKKRQFQLLGLYRERALAFSDAYETVAFQQSVGREKHSDVARCLGALLMEVEVGYNRLVRGAAQPPAIWTAGEPWPFAAYAAMQLAGLSMLHSYRANLPLFPGIFRETNFLYRVAETHGALRIPVPEAAFGNDKPTVSRLFKTIQIFHLSDPFSYQDGEISRGFATTGRYAESGRISIDPPESEGPIFVVDIAGSNPPEAGRDPRMAQARYLDLAPVLTALKRDRQNASPQESMTSGLAGHLIKQLRAHTIGRDGPDSGDRQVARREIPVRASIGIDSIHHFLKDGGRRLAEALKDAGDTMQIRLRAKNGRVLAHKLDTWLLSQEPSKSYRLRQPGIGHIDAESGELIGISRGGPDTVPNLDLGVISWARHDAQDRIHISVRPICKGAPPATCTNGSGKGHAQDAISCLHIAREQNTMGVTLLLAPAYTQWENTQILLELERSTKLVRVGRRRPDIASLACYELPGRTNRAS